jgi:hypothetical protein
MQKVNIVVLKATTTSEKGNKTTFCKVEQSFGGFSSEIAVGFIKTDKDLEVGKTMTMSINGVTVRKSTTPVLIDGVDVYLPWLVIDFAQPETAE